MREDLARRFSGILENVDTPHGELHHLRPVAELSETAPRWELPTVPLGTHDPVWEARP
jgi:hypothetical protein